MEDKGIVQAIQEARKSIDQYLKIMELFPNVDVSRNQEFQRIFIAFYKVRRPLEWCKEYYSYMDKHKKVAISFESVLEDLYQIFDGRHEASFSSKLTHTLDPDQPIWDSHVLQYLNLKAPYNGSNNRLERIKAVYQSIREWYATKTQSEEGQLIITTFDRLVEKHELVTDLKKIDFYIWKRGNVQ